MPCIDGEPKLSVFLLHQPSKFDALPEAGNGHSGMAILS